MDSYDTFLRLGSISTQVSQLRQLAWQRIIDHLDLRREGLGVSLSLELGRLCVLLSSSRGGTSAVAEVLQWQGSDFSEKAARLLSLPGEERPHFILAGLAFPGRLQLFDDLGSDDAQAHLVSRLLAEMRSEAGFPISSCTDLYLYAIQLYRRMLLQWPRKMIALDQQASIERLEDSLRRAFGDVYHDSVDNRRLVLDCCVGCFPFVLASFYDCSKEKHFKDLFALEEGGWSFEECPFIMPPPWHNADYEDIANGVLLLRDPANAWRLSFLKAIFPLQDVIVLHQVRDPEESIYGLCEGWNYPFGFQSLPSITPLRIKGYADEPTTAANLWKRFRLNFAIDRKLSRELTDGSLQQSIVAVCGHQWLAAHEQIMRDSELLSLQRLILRFSSFRSDAARALVAICQAINMEPSRSGLKSAGAIASNLVMATHGGLAPNSRRWMGSPQEAEIRQLVAQHQFSAAKKELFGASCDQIL